MSRNGSITELKAPGNISWRRLLLWWAERIEANPESHYRVDLTSLDEQKKEALGQVVTACGHATGSKRRLQLFPTDSSTFLLMETIFADTETSYETLVRLLAMYRQSLLSIADQNHVADVSAVHVTYCSVDKTQELITLSRLINELNDRSNLFRFVLVPYIHPKEGYPAGKTGHIDALRLPNKYFSENSIKLTRKGIARLQSESELKFAKSLRLTIDDDDLWLPWAVEELVSIGEAAFERGGRDTKAIGVANQIVYYPTGTGRLDVADWDLAMTGSKFFISNSFERLMDLTPWMLPEAFSDVQERQFRRVGVDLSIVRGTRPFFVYVRSHGNLSGMLKTDHYIGNPVTRFGVGSYYDARNVAIKLVQSEMGVRKSDDYVFSVDPPSLSVRGTFEEESGELKLEGNFDEYMSRRNIPVDSGIKVVVSAGTDDGRIEVEKALEDDLVYDASGWTSRPLLRIENEYGEKLGSAWIRGKARFLS